FPLQAGLFWAAVWVCPDHPYQLCAGNFSILSQGAVQELWVSSALERPSAIRAEPGYLSTATGDRQSPLAVPNEEVIVRVVGTLLLEQKRPMGGSAAGTSAWKPSPLEQHPVSSVSSPPNILANIPPESMISSRSCATLRDQLFKTSGTGIEQSRCPSAFLVRAAALGGQHCPLR